MRLDPRFSREILYARPPIRVATTMIHGQRIAQLYLAAATMVAPAHVVHPPLVSQRIGGRIGLIQSPIFQELFILTESEYYQIGK